MSGQDETKLYSDPGVVCGATGLTVKMYYLWGGSKTIPYSSIRGVNRINLSGLSGKWRIWGSGDLVHWWNLDTKRPKKNTALAIELGGHIIPTITPDDPDTVEKILKEKIGQP